MIHNSKHIHMIGITGQGMTALAELLLAAGKHITGSDTTKEEFSTNAVLKELGVRVNRFDKKNILSGINLVIRSSAYGNEHEEVATARAAGIPVMLYVDAVAELFNVKRGILITGTHGKTTTTAMIGRVLEDAGFDPAVLVGATVIDWGKNGRAGRGEWFVAEGDEYQGKFLKMNPEILVITNIEYDHPDFYKTKKEYQDAFRERARTMPANGLVVAEESLQNVLADIPCRVEWFGIAGEKTGHHQELNEAAALTVADYLGIRRQKANETLKHFRGTARRMEFYTAPDAAVVVIDDYAHHPTEIITTLAALRARYLDRHITAVFHPHTYSRTEALLGGFAAAFVDADDVLLLPVYSSMRERKEDFSPDLVEALKNGIERVSKKPARVVYSLKEAVEVGRTLPPLQQKRVFITLGAGNCWEIARDVAVQGSSK